MATEEPKTSNPGRWQFSLRTLLVVVVFIAVGCGALVAASETWLTIVYSATFAVLFIAVLGGLFRRGRTRAFWAGFAVIGWLYLVLVYGLWEENGRPRLATTQTLVFVWNTVIYKAPGSVSITGEVQTQSSPLIILQLQEMEKQSFYAQRGISPTTVLALPSPLFLDIGQYLWTLILAYLGGLLALYFYSTRADQS